MEVGYKEGDMKSGEVGAEINREGERCMRDALTFSC